MRQRRRLPHEPLEEIANDLEARMNCEAIEVERVLGLVQMLEPTRLAPARWANVIELQRAALQP